MNDADRLDVQMSMLQGQKAEIQDLRGGAYRRRTVEASPQDTPVSLQMIRPEQRQREQEQPSPNVEW